MANTEEMKVPIRLVAADPLERLVNLIDRIATEGLVITDNLGRRFTISLNGRVDAPEIDATQNRRSW